MIRYHHLNTEKDNFGRVLNTCPYGKTHKNGALIFIGGISCVQCKCYHGLDDDGLVVCGFGIDNTSKKKKRDTYSEENKN